MVVHLPDFSVADVSRYWSLFKAHCGAWHRLQIDGRPVLVYTEKVPRAHYLEACESFEGALKLNKGRGLSRVYRTAREAAELEVEYDAPRHTLIAASPNAELLRRFLNYLPSRELTPLEKELDGFLQAASPLPADMLEEFFGPRTSRTLATLVDKRRAYNIGAIVLHRSTLPPELLPPSEKEFRRGYAGALVKAAGLSMTKLRLGREEQEVRETAQKLELLRDRGVER